jgi:hypothetical protein
MRRSLFALPALLLLGAFLTSPNQGAGQAGGAAVAGTWRLRSDAASGEATVRNAIELVVGRMRADLQPLARERIAESTWLPTRIRIGASRGRVQVALDGAERRTFASPIGQPVQVPMRSGEYAQLVQSVRADGAVEQRFVALDGTQQNLYLPGPSRTMTLDVTLQSPVFPSAIHFLLEYERGR